MRSRLTALPDAAESVQRARLLAALLVGNQIMSLRGAAPLLALGPKLDAALEAVARGDGADARVRLARLDHDLAAGFDGEPEASLALGARASCLAIAEALAQHAAYFDAGALA